MDHPSSGQAPTSEAFAPSFFRFGRFVVSWFKRPPFAWRNRMFWSSAADPMPPPPTDGRAHQMRLPFVDCRQEPFTALVGSWHIETPPGTVATPAVRVRVGGRLSPWYALARWGQGTHPETGESLPHSLPVQRDGPGPAWVDIDTLRLKPGLAADGFQLRVTLRGSGTAVPHVHRLAATTYQRGQAVGSAARAAARTAVRLAVPERSQQVEDPSIAGLICSPTSVGMVLAYYGVDRPTAEVAAGVRDQSGAEIYGNWPFNTAYAATHGLEATVRHFPDLDAVEAELRAGHPVILSVRWQAGELPEAPIPQTKGHLIVATGVDEHGDFLVNDPASDPRRGQPIARCYPRARLAHAFTGIGYMIAPPAPVAPTDH
jgi:hypothetical protein